jgi:hypothetical protein
MKGNVTFLLLVGVAALITALFLVPYLSDIGHPSASIPFFVFFAVLFIYGRHNSKPKPKLKS